jgi:hypothetical protein
MKNIKRKQIKKVKEVKVEIDPEEAEIAAFDLGAVEKDCCKQNFQFYDKE